MRGATRNQWNFPAPSKPPCLPTLQHQLCTTGDGKRSGRAIASMDVVANLATSKLKKYTAVNMHTYQHHAVDAAGLLGSAVRPNAPAQLQV